MSVATLEKPFGAYTSYYTGLTKGLDLRRAKLMKQNADELAIRLGCNIEIYRDFPSRGCNAVVKLFQGLSHGVSHFDGCCTADKMRIFGTRCVDSYSRIVRFNSLREKLEEFSASIADHTFTLKSDGKIIGTGFSPYVWPLHFSNENLVGDLTDIFQQLMDCMSPEFRDKYDVFVLPPDKTIYYPGHTVSIVFIKKVKEI